MYKKFFGFKENPFKLVPNPEYLFLGKSHEETLAHLSYAIYHGDGFVEIIGEVGTGKTTLCRVFLENLDNSIEAAYIFNPKLDALQLLKVINDEFGIDSTPDNTKDLIDRLNSFLIEKKRGGKKALVIIDEAQNLSLEVLEQLRLLSNLETTQEKLLQIILVGQPELGEILSSHQLRQLGQRITINCQLTPLTFQETKDYIKHRIALASHRAGPPFDKVSFRVIYEYSRGIPRLINIACDRALLNAFSHSSYKITGAIAKEAIRELNHPKTKISPWQHVPSYLALTVILLAFIGALLYLNISGNAINLTTSNKTYSLPDTARINVNIESIAKGLQPEIRPDPPASLQKSAISVNYDKDHQAVPDSMDLTPDPALTSLGEADAEQEHLRVESGGIIAPVVYFGSNQAEAPHGELNVIPASAQLSLTSSSASDDQTQLDNAAEQFLNFLKSLNSRPSRNTAILQALRLWSPHASITRQTRKIESDPVFFRGAAGQNELLAHPMATDLDLNLVHALDLPVVLTFYLPNHTWPKYLTLAGLDAENAYLDAGEQGGIIPVDRRILLRFWSGEAYIVWKNFLELDGIITESSEGEAVKNLKMLLLDLSYTVDISSSRYDVDTKRFIENIQRKNGLEVDGKVGPFTKIALYNESRDFIKPSLVKFADRVFMPVKFKSSPPAGITPTTK